MDMIFGNSGGSGDSKKKPCRACHDFKSWAKLHQAEAQGQTTVKFKQIVIEIIVLK